MSPTTDIVNAMVIDGVGEAPRTGCTIRLEGNRIVALWDCRHPPTDRATPADRTIDAVGKTVMPGLIDAHCHISYGEGRSAEEVDVYGGAEWAAVRAVWNSNKVLRAGGDQLLRSRLDLVGCSNGTGRHSQRNVPWSAHLRSRSTYSVGWRLCGLFPELARHAGVGRRCALLDA